MSAQREMLESALLKAYVLDYALKYGHTEFVEMVLGHSAEVGKSVGHLGLHTAVAMGDLEVLKVLLDSGAEVNWKDKR